MISKPQQNISSPPQQYWTVKVNDNISTRAKCIFEDNLRTLGIDVVALDALHKFPHVPAQREHVRICVMLHPLLL